ncbi:1821_t:CDS:10 [Ambispora leptoticha]|uniref:1821_t:CDS:1 n=1 Tax=Ambispora leptoticha TaxID=144679 RepID=A0A9N9GCZ8_9GLOM|nr:1821_t:CDS:10 [Ambispora leptoticha]
MELSNVSAQYFEATPIDGWSYLGYLEAMKPYFYNYASITSLKSSWRKSFLATLRTFEKCQDQERSEVATFLINELAVKNQTQSSALDMLNVATSNQTNQVIKLLEEESDEKYPSIERREELDGPSSKNASSNPDPDASEEDQEEEESADEIDKFFMDKGNNEKIRNGVTSNDIGIINFVERIEESKPMSSTCQRPWVLRSGTNITWMFDDDSFNYGFSYSLAYWNILDLTENTQMKSLFSTNDWEEMVESFNNEVKLIESNFLDVVEYFFDEVEKITKKDDKDIINAIDRLTPEIIETNRKVELSDGEKNVISILRRAVVAYGEIACWASAYRRNEVVPLFSELALDKSLRSGGLPEPHKKKIYEDKVDLSVAMRDILYTFFKENSKAPSSDIHSTFVFGIHSWGWVHNIYGMDCKATNILRLCCISHSKMPNTLKTLSVLESFYVLFTDLQTTLNTICEHTNSVSLADSRAHRNRKRKNLEQAGEKGGSFGNPSQSPASKKGRKYEDH